MQKNVAHFSFFSAFPLSGRYKNYSSVFIQILKEVQTLFRLLKPINYHACTLSFESQRERILLPNLKYKIAIFTFISGLSLIIGSERNWHCTEKKKNRWVPKNYSHRNKYSIGIAFECAWALYVSRCISLFSGCSEEIPDTG